MSLRTLIVDDEPVARQRLRRFLASEDSVEIIGECGDGGSAVESILTEKPDLVLLDIQLPELDGFQVLSALGVDRMPIVIFVTAHDEHALRAFEAQAMDYILKPVREERLRAAVKRAFAIRSSRLDWDARVAALLSDLRKAKPPGPLAIRTDGRVVLLEPGEIDWVEAEGGYLRIHAGSRSLLLRAAMHALHDRLGTDRFCRIHRSTLVNFDAIREIRPVHSGESVLILKNGQRLKTSRSSSQHFREKFTTIG